MSRDIVALLWAIRCKRADAIAEKFGLTDEWFETIRDNDEFAGRYFAPPQ